MVDYFALLEEPRQPWLDPEELKGKFLALSATVHPDRVHGADPDARRLANEQFAALNTAYNCLREPRDRVLHLLELERGSRPREVQRIPPGTMELFQEIGQACRETDAFLADRAKTTSPLLRVQMFARAVESGDRLAALLQRIRAQREAVFGELEALNAVWAAAPPPGAPERQAALPLDRLETLYRGLSYTNRWASQIEERRVQLAT